MLSLEIKNLLDFYKEKSYISNPESFHNLEQDLENINKINEEQEYIQLINKIESDIGNIDKSLKKDNMNRFLQNIGLKFENGLSRVAAVFANDKNLLNDIKNSFIPEKGFMYKYVSDELYLMGLIRSSVLNLNFLGALTNCKIFGQVFDKSDSAVLPSSSGAWWARASKDSVSATEKIAKFEYNENGEIDIKSTMLKYSNEIYNSDDKFSKTILMFSLFASDKNFDYVVEKNKNILENFLEENINKDREIITSYGSKMMDKLRQNYKSKFGKDITEYKGPKQRSLENNIANGNTDSVYHR